MENIIRKLAWDSVCKNSSGWWCDDDKQIGKVCSEVNYT